MKSLKIRLKQKQEPLSSPHGLFKNEDGAIDLASIMVGIIVIGLIGGVIASTIFVVIPWAQDNAAKHQLDSIVQAENAYFGLSSATPSPLPAGSPTNSFADSTGLANANLLQSGQTHCVVTSNAGKNYQGYSASASGSIWSVADTNSKPVVFTGTLPSNCQFILTPAGSTVTPTPSPSPTSPWSQQTTTNPGPIIGTSGNFATQLASAAGSVPYVSANSGALWTSTPTATGGNFGSSSQNGQYLLVGKNIASGGAGPVNFSTNGGTSWSPLTALGNTYVSQAWVSNDGTKIVVAGGGGGANVSIRISTDSGATFTPVKYIGSSDKWMGLAVSNDGSRIYAVDSTATLHISANGGTTWSTKVIAGSAGTATTGVSTDATGQRVLMNTAQNGKVLISNDYAATFTAVAVGTAINQKRTVSQQAMSSDGQVMTVTGIESTTTEVFISRDAGQTWNIQTGLPNLPWVSRVSSDGTQYLISSGTTAYKAQE